jgi:hypothetical protein
MKRVDVVGNKYGRLTVLAYANTNTRGEVRWLCKCDCGTEKTYLGTSFKYGKTKSCGCLHKEIISGTNNYQAKRAIEKHGEYISSNDPWYNRASSIIRLAKQRNIPVGFKSISEFALYLRSIAPKKCPVFNKAFTEVGNGASRWSPSVDKIIPSKGYVKGNIQVISFMANTMKQEATPKQLKQFARWVQGT